MTIICVISLDCLTIDGDVHPIRIQRYETRAEHLFRLGKFDELSKILQLAAVGQESLTDYTDTEYIGPIMVGTPGVVLYIFDIRY